MLHGDILKASHFKENVNEQKLMCHLYSCVKNNKLKWWIIHVEPDVPSRAVTRSLLLYFYPALLGNPTSLPIDSWGLILKIQTVGLDLSHRESSELNFPSGNGKRERGVRGKNISPLAGVEMRRCSAHRLVGRWVSRAPVGEGWILSLAALPLSDACECVYGCVGDPSVYQNVRESFSRPAARRIFYLFLHRAQKEVMQSERFIRVAHGAPSKFSLSLTVSYIGCWVTGRLWVLLKIGADRAKGYIFGIERRPNRFFSAGEMLLTVCKSGFSPNREYFAPLRIRRLIKFALGSERVQSGGLQEREK